MKLQVCVAFNQQGINLTQKKSHVFIIESDTTLDEKEIAERIYKEVPEVLIDSYSVGFSLPLIDVKVGDVLKMVHVIENKNFSQTLTKMVKVSQIEDGHLRRCTVSILNSILKANVLPEERGRIFLMSFFPPRKRLNLTRKNRFVGNCWRK